MKDGMKLEVWCPKRLRGYLSVPASTVRDGRWIKFPLFGTGSASVIYLKLEVFRESGRTRLTLQAEDSRAADLLTRVVGFEAA